MLKRILIAIAVLVVAAIVVVAGEIVYLSRPTSGEPIPAYDKPRRALLVIDIQEDYTGPKAVRPYRDGDKIVATSNRLIGVASALGIDEVVYVANEFDGPLVSLLAGGANAPGSFGASIDARIDKAPGGKLFVKHRSDAFSNPALDAFLRERGVGDLYVTGLDAAHCVKATVLGARNRGYKVTVLADGIATESADSVDELLPAYREAGAAVTTSAELLRPLQ